MMIANIHTMNNINQNTIPSSMNDTTTTAITSNHHPQKSSPLLSLVATFFEQEDGGLLNNDSSNNNNNWKLQQQQQQQQQLKQLQQQLQQLKEQDQQLQHLKPMEDQQVIEPISIWDPSPAKPDLFMDSSTLSKGIIPTSLQKVIQDDFTNNNVDNARSNCMESTQQQQQQQQHPKSSPSPTPSTTKTTDIINNKKNDESLLLSKLSNYDVICGRNKLAFNNVGNRRFRITISLYLKRYFDIPNRLDRSMLIYEIIDVIHESGGKFYKQSGEYNWIELNQKESRNKVGHALRDAAASYHRNNKNNSNKKIKQTTTTTTTTK